MKLRTCTVSLVTLSAAVLLGTAAFAGDLPKEGKFTATYSSAGTFKGSPIGKEALFSNFDENGLSLGDGLFDHLSWHCFGLYEVLKGMAQFRGHCIATDPAGDQLASDFVSDGTFPADAKNHAGPARSGQARGSMPASVVAGLLSPTAQSSKRRPTGLMCSTVLMRAATSSHNYGRGSLSGVLFHE